MTFFYNGGPGSASVWLHLGSFGPKRLATGVPATTAARPFPLVDNADSLLASTDLVFVDAVGSGRSQAIAPYRNRDFWSVGADAALFRDAIRRWLQLNGRQASPFFLYGESYGGPRTAVLARRLQEAGSWPAGLILQSPALDYNSNCGVTDTAAIPCTGYLPSYAATGAWHGLSTPVPTDLDGWLAGARDFAATRYAPALQDWLDAALPAPDLWLPLAALTGLPAAQWQQQFNLGPTRYRERLLAGRLIGRYDARMSAPVGSALAAEGDPSSTWIGSSFVAAIDRYLRDTLRYRNASTYVLSSSAIQHWDFSHAGRRYPDTVPDLAAALAADPALRVLAVNGVHDLATPFHVTESDLARLGSERVSVRNYAGGHMSFLDDATRPRQKADIAAFLAAGTADRPLRRSPLAAAAAPDPRQRRRARGGRSGRRCPSRRCRRRCATPGCRRGAEHGRAGQPEQQHDAGGQERQRQAARRAGRVAPVAVLHAWRRLQGRPGRRRPPALASAPPRHQPDQRRAPVVAAALGEIGLVLAQFDDVQVGKGLAQQGLRYTGATRRRPAGAVVQLLRRVALQHQRAAGLQAALACGRTGAARSAGSANCTKIAATPS